MRGIDVSSYQGDIDWKKAQRAGVEFAILKVIRKDLAPDKTFEQNYKECERLGILVQGVYQYSYATTVEKAKIDARKVLEVLGNRKPMVWLDVEDKCQMGLGGRLLDIILAYKEIIEESGRQFGVYTGLSFYDSYVKKYSADLYGVPFWIARYPSKNTTTIKAPINILKKPDISNRLYGWQYSSTCIVDGIKGNVDVNEWYVKIEQNFLWSSANQMPVLRYGDSGEEVKKMQELLLKNRFKTAIVMVNGKEVRKNLTPDGKFGAITKSALMRFQGYMGLEQTGICNKPTWVKLIIGGNM